MDTARYKAFLFSAQTGSFTKAAERLNYTPSGVSQLVTALEQELSLELLKRSKKGVTLTDAGEEILPAVRELLHQEEKIQQIAGSVNELLTGSITVAAFSSIAASWLPRVIRSFHERYPGVSIKIMEGNSKQIEKWLSERLVDLGFYSYYENMKEEWFPLQDVHMQAILPKDHPLAGKKAYPVEEFAREHLIVASRGRAEDVDTLLDTYGITADYAFSTLEGYSAIAMVEQGLGISLMNELIARRFQADVVKLPLDPPQSAEFGIAIPSYTDASPAARKFVDCAVKMLTSLAFPEKS